MLHYKIFHKNSFFVTNVWKNYFEKNRNRSWNGNMTAVEDFENIYVIYKKENNC